MPIEFGDVIEKNYLKIVTNIYFLNLRKVAKQIKSEFFDTFDKVEKNNGAKSTLSPAMINKEIFSLYEKNLKQTR